MSNIPKSINLEWWAQKWSKLNMFALLVLQQKAYMHCFQGSNQRWICYLVYKWVTHKSQYNLLMSNCATLSKSTMKFCFKPTDSVSKKTSHILAWLNSPPAYLSFWEFVLYSPLLSFVFSFFIWTAPYRQFSYTVRSSWETRNQSYNEYIHILVDYTNRRSSR